MLSPVIVAGTSDTLSPDAQVTYTGYFAKGARTSGISIATAIRPSLKLSYTCSMPGLARGAVIVSSQNVELQFPEILSQKNSTSAVYPRAVASRRAF
ncbi:MAG: hypothetical protein ACLPI9_02235 [Halobacteriota archaeon]